MFNPNQYKAPPLNDNIRLQTVTVGYAEKIVYGYQEVTILGRYL